LNRSVFKKIPIDFFHGLIFLVIFFGFFSLISFLIFFLTHNNYLQLLERKTKKKLIK
jgi:hypothetical protein